MEVDTAPQVGTEEVSRPVGEAVSADSAPEEAPVSVRAEAIHLRGVDELNTKDIEAYMQHYYATPFRVEWVDDSGLNVVYDDPEDAFQALVALTDDSEFTSDTSIPPGQLRKIKAHPKKTDVVLHARFALNTDQKSSGSRSRSRYYLLNGEPDRKEDIVRFGTKRSQPQVYGLGKRDLVKKSRREDRAGDLFPMKEESKIAVDDDMMDDLLPHKSRRRRRGGRGRGKTSEPDLFADKLKTIGNKGPRKAVDNSRDKNSGQGEPASGSGVYQNMDY